MSFAHLVGQVFRVVKHPNFLVDELVYVSETNEKPGKDPARVMATILSNYQGDRRINAKYLSDHSRFIPFSFEPVVRGSRFVITPESARVHGRTYATIIITSVMPTKYVIPFFNCTIIKENGERRTIERNFLSLLKLIDPASYTRLPNASIPKPGRIVSRKPRNMIPRVRQSSVRIKNREEIIAGIMAGLEKLPPWDQQEVIFRMMEANRGMGMGMGGFSMLSHCRFEDRRPMSAR